MRIWMRARGAARLLPIAIVIGLAALPTGAGLPDLPAPSISPPAPSPPAEPPRVVLPHPSTAEPFGPPGADQEAPSFALKWRTVSKAIAAEANVLTRCRREPEHCSSVAQRFLDIIEAGRARHGRARLGEINRAVNLAIRYVSDAADEWAPPLATLASAEGDCEDYAIAKYVALREAGVPQEDLRFLVVRDTRIGEHHAVLAARLDARWLVLDNRRLFLLETGDLPVYVTVAAFTLTDDVLAAEAEEAAPRATVAGEGLVLRRAVEDEGRLPSSS